MFQCCNEKLVVLNFSPPVLHTGPEAVVPRCPTLRLTLESRSMEHSRVGIDRTRQDGTQVLLFSASQITRKFTCLQGGSTYFMFVPLSAGDFNGDYSGYTNNEHVRSTCYVT
jgi:hypothetical protein